MKVYTHNGLIETPRGWRKLGPDEVIKEGDMVNVGNEWVTSSAAGFNVSESKRGKTYIRKNDPKARADKPKTKEENVW